MKTEAAHEEYCDMFGEYDREREDALWREATWSVTGEDRDEALDIAAERPDLEWILTSRDAWHKNPFYRGAPGPHPEDDSCWVEDEDEDTAPVEVEAEAEADESDRFNDLPF